MDNYISDDNPDVSTLHSEADLIRSNEADSINDAYAEKIAVEEALAAEDSKELEETEDGAEDVYPDCVSVINYHNITHDDMLNGDGLRVVLWVAGCDHHCKGCQNPCTWDPNGGIPLSEKDESEFWEWLGKSWTQGATFSGGDPLHPANRGYIGYMIEKIKKEFPGKDIWLYTGYTLKKTEDGFVFADANGKTFSYPYLKDIDVLVDGMFEEETRKADIAAQKTVHWRGSSDQNLIDVKKTLLRGEIVTKKCDEDTAYCCGRQGGGCGA